MAGRGQARYNWEGPEDSYPLSPRRSPVQPRHGTGTGTGSGSVGASSTEYNPYGGSSPGRLLSRNPDLYYVPPTAVEPRYEEFGAPIHSPPPVRQTSGRGPRVQQARPDAAGYWTTTSSPYAPVPNYDTSHILPPATSGEEAEPAQTQGHYNYYNIDANASGNFDQYQYSGSGVPSINTPSFMASTTNMNFNDSTIPLNAPAPGGASQKMMTDPHVYEAADDPEQQAALARGQGGDDSNNPYVHDADTLLNRAANNLHIKSALGWSNPNFFHDRAWFSWSSPHSYQLPGEFYTKSPSSTGGAKYMNMIFKHRDVFRRKYAAFFNDDRFLDPLDGRVRKLFVQAIDELYDAENDTTWRRTYIENVSPYIIRLAYWPYAHMPDPNADPKAYPGAWESQQLDSREQSRALHLHMGSWKQEQWAHVGLRWLPACVGLLLLMCFPTDVQGQVRNHGCYDPVPYRNWTYPKSARNFHENLGEKPNGASAPIKQTSGGGGGGVGAGSSSSASTTKDMRLADRCLRPRLLCFLDAQTPDNPRGCLDPQTWIDSHGGSGVEPTYIFISYTAEKQFERRCRMARAEIQATGASDCACSLCQHSASDAEALHKFARLAARKAQVAAYWTDQCCMSTDRDELQDDVYRISDVVRGAAKIVIVVGRTGQDRLPPSVTTLMLLREWGTRMWTWPEVLLGPAREKIQVYTRGGTDENSPLEISKMEFPAQVWDDGEVARQLIDNYENTLTLSRLELVVLALESLKLRVETGTTKYLEGDLSYALMGLLRQRPKVDATDSAFQAFARLSLANDSDRLLERMICLLPVETDTAATQHEIDEYTEQPIGGRHLEAPQQSSSEEEQQQKKRRHYWTNLNDYWGANLWDIEPLCQVAGIGQDETVILDGAFAATIKWDKFERVAITTRETWSRMLARYFVRGTPGWFFIALLTLALGGAGNSSAKGIGAFLLVIALVTVLLSPLLICHIYGGKLWNSQPWLFGFEGHLPLHEIESKIFGFPADRLSWAPYASAMSRHRVNNDFLDTECEGADPLLAGAGIGGVEDERFRSSSASDEKMRLFTLVDTNTMTVTNFVAARPPVVALLCGSEGGMQRAALCSYDWTTQTLWRETVLRMETTVLEKMPRVGRVRFGLRRWQEEKCRSYLQPPA